MQDDIINVRLRLPELAVLGVKETKGWIEVVACCRREEGVCLRCGVGTWQVHQWHLQHKRDAKLWGKEVWLAVLKRRFRCRRCRKVFMEPDPACGRGRRTTKRLREVLNYWRYPLTNALVEGKHNRIKVLKRRAYGYRNQRSFLPRILNLIHTD